MSFFEIETTTQAQEKVDHLHDLLRVLRHQGIITDGTWNMLKYDLDLLTLFLTSLSNQEVNLPVDLDDMQQE